MVWLAAVVVHYCNGQSLTTCEPPLIFAVARAVAYIMTPCSSRMMTLLKSQVATEAWNALVGVGVGLLVCCLVALGCGGGVLDSVAYDFEAPFNCTIM